MNRGLEKGETEREHAEESSDLGGNLVVFWNAACIAHECMYIKCACACVRGSVCGSVKTRIVGKNEPVKQFGDSHRFTWHIFYCLRTKNQWLNSLVLSERNSEKYEPK